MAMAANSVPREQRGLAPGVRFTALRFGSTLSPLLLGLVAGVCGLEAIFVAASVLCIVGALGFCTIPLGCETDRFRAAS